MSAADEVHRVCTYPPGVAEPQAPALTATCGLIESGPVRSRCRSSPRRLDLADLAPLATHKVRDWGAA